MKIIFLDIDGVLNSLTSWVAYHPYSYDESHLDQVAVALVKRLSDITGAKLVISSSWRHEYKEEGIRNILEKHGWINPPIIGLTPDISFEKRSYEIKKYLDDIQEDGNNIESYVILDDTYINESLHKNHIIEVDEIYGFTVQDFIRALIILDPVNPFFTEMYDKQPLLANFDDGYYKRVLSEIDNDAA